MTTPNSTIPKDSWAYVLFEKLHIIYDCGQFYSSCLYKDCLKPLQLETAIKENATYYFVILLVQLQCPRRDFTSELSQSDSFRPEHVKMTTFHEIHIIQFPALLEIWKNQFDNYDIWKKPETLTKWVNLLTIGPFIGYQNAQVFETGWINIARGLTTKLVKIQSLVSEYNQQLDKFALYGRTRPTSPVMTIPNIKIYITPLKKEEHFTETTSSLYTPENVFDGGTMTPMTVLNPTYNWNLDLSLDLPVTKSPNLQRLCDLLV